MTPETLLRLVADDRASQRIFERRRHGSPVTDREIERAEFLKVADAGLVKNVVVTKHVGLTDMPLTKAVKDRFRDGVGTVGNCVRDVLTSSREFVSVVTVLERQAGACREDLAIRRDFQRLGHRRVHLRRLARVTIETRFVADKLETARVCVRPPLREKRIRLRAADKHNQSTDYTDDTDYFHFLMPEPSMTFT